MLTVNIHPARAVAVSHERTTDCRAFSTLRIDDESGSYVTVFLPAGRAQMVADAINAALAPAVKEAAE